MLRLQKRYGAMLLILPGLLFLAMLFVWPVGRLVATSFAGWEDPFAQYERILTSTVYLRVLARTFLLSAEVVGLCLLLGYPLAYVLSRVGPLARVVIILCVLIPFWTNLLVRSYGWIILLNPQGALNGLLELVGLGSSPVPLVYNSTGVLIGMTQIMLPYCVLPLAAVMSRIDPNLESAARSLGASPLAAFRRIYFPLTLPGVFAGCLLVFMISLGFFVVPAILGGPGDILLAQLIEFNINNTLNWPFAAALSTLLLVATLLIYLIGDRFFDLGRLWGAR
ncbi:MAG: ABC transporter permease [Flavobacteriaceae bacterium]